MASELTALGRAAARLVRRSPMTVDLTGGILVRAIRKDRSRISRSTGPISTSPARRTDADLRDIAWAIARARRSDPDLHPSAFDVLESRADRGTRRRCGRRSSAEPLRSASPCGCSRSRGPVTAKGVEDTAFYRYNRFVALNEVGGAPDRFGRRAAGASTRRTSRAHGHWPHAMLATATHDTKRGEDTRARLAVLSEQPEEWRRQVAAWSRILRARSRRRRGLGAAPDRNDEYML